METHQNENYVRSASRLRRYGRHWKRLLRDILIIVICVSGVALFIPLYNAFPDTLDYLGHYLGIAMNYLAIVIGGLAIAYLVFVIGILSVSSIVAIAKISIPEDEKYKTKIPIDKIVFFIDKLPNPLASSRGKKLMFWILTVCAIGLAITYFYKSPLQKCIDSAKGVAEYLACQRMNRFNELPGQSNFH